MYYLMFHLVGTPSPTILKSYETQREALSARSKMIDVGGVEYITESDGIEYNHFFPMDKILTLTVQSGLPESVISQRILTKLDMV